MRASSGRPVAATAMACGNEVPSARRMAVPRSKSAATSKGIFCQALQPIHHRGGRIHLAALDAVARPREWRSSARRRGFLQSRAPGAEIPGRRSRRIRRIRRPSAIGLIFRRATCSRAFLRSTLRRLAAIWKSNARTLKWEAGFALACGPSGTSGARRAATTARVHQSVSGLCNDA